MPEHKSYSIYCFMLPSHSYSEIDAQGVFFVVNHNMTYVHTVQSRDRLISVFVTYEYK